MGTRHLIAVQIGGEYKVAQYGQWDGYPTGQGFGVLEFLRASENVAALREKAPTTRWITPEEHDATWREVGHDPAEQWVGMDKSERRKALYPHLSRDAGAKILGLVARGEPGIALGNSIDFAGDSLMCEWAYVVDLDADRLEVFQGFNKSPVSDEARFAKCASDAAAGYYPVRLVASWSLDALPTNDEMRALEERDEDAAS